jgi:hypothetical protein
VVDHSGFVCIWLESGGITVFNVQEMKGIDLYVSFGAQVYFGTFKQPFVLLPTD